MQAKFKKNHFPLKIIEDENIEPLQSAENHIELMDKSPAYLCPCLKINKQQFSKLCASSKGQFQIFSLLPALSTKLHCLHCLDCLRESLFNEYSQILKEMTIDTKETLSFFQFAKLNHLQSPLHTPQGFAQYVNEFLQLIDLESHGLGLESHLQKSLVVRKMSNTRFYLSAQRPLSVEELSILVKLFFDHSGLIISFANLT